MMAEMRLHPLSISGIFGAYIPYLFCACKTYPRDEVVLKTDIAAFCRPNQIFNNICIICQNDNIDDAITVFSTQEEIHQNLTQIV